LCTKVSNLIYLIDPFTLSMIDMPGSSYFAQPFRSISSSSGLIPYTILDVQPLGPTRGKFVLADVTVARTADFGSNDTQFLTRTHLGHLLHPGDSCLGYDLSTANFNDMDLEGLRGRSLPDLILVRKSYPERRKSGKARVWKLKQLDKDVDDDKRDHEIEKEHVDYERFMQDLEEDPELRVNVNLYKDNEAVERLSRKHDDAHMDDEVDDAEEFPEVQLSELLEEMTVQDDEDEVEEDE